MQILLNINRDGTTIMLVTHDVKVAAKTERVLFMADGEIVSEIQLGKLRNDDLKAREEKLLKWLAIDFKRKLLLNVGVFLLSESSKRCIIIF